jgi:hypothetical protein
MSIFLLYNPEHAQLERGGTRVFVPGARVSSRARNGPEE